MRYIGVIWGVIGVSAILLNAIIRVSDRALDTIQAGLSPFEWIVLVVFALFMLVAEGYRGFQKKFSPRTAARVRYLRENPTPLRVILAPFFSMGFFHANTKTRITIIILTLGIITLILLVKFFCPDPWRGIIDFGVALGLSWGVISFWIYTAKALTSKDFPHSPQTPNEQPSSQ